MEAAPASSYDGRWVDCPWCEQPIYKGPRYITTYQTDAKAARGDKRVASYHTKCWEQAEGYIRRSRRAAR